MDRIRNAAIILLGVGEECAVEILKNMNPSEVQKIMDAINNIDHVKEDDVAEALNQFFLETDNASGIDIVSREHIKNTLSSALGIKGIERIDTEKARWLELLKHEALDNIIDIIEEEHPQIITALVVVLTQLGSDTAPNIIKRLPRAVQNNIILRMSGIGAISTFAFEVFSNFFEKELQNTGRYNVITVDGIEAAANLISYLDTETEREIINNLSDTNKVLAEQIQDKLLPFEKLSQLDSKSLQVLLREVNNDDLIVALKGVSDNIKNIFMQNMSTKAAEILRDELEAKGPVKLATVVEAQKKIILLAKKLNKEEKIILSSKNDPDVVF